MNGRRLVVACLIVLLTGCVRLGNTNLLITPVGVVGVHSFEPPAGQGRDVLAEAAREEDINRQALTQ